MFFILSKIFWWIFAPLNLLFLLIVIAIIFMSRGRKKLAKWLLTFCFLSFAIGGYTQITNLPLVWLENRYTIPDLNNAPYGIIVLGGGVSSTLGRGKTKYQLLDGADRIIQGIALKRKFPEARLIYSGGDASLLRQQEAESNAAAALVRDLMGENFHVELEQNSRNTWENGVFTLKMLSEHEYKERWVLVTSAWHMSRAMGVFRKLGLVPIPYPTDYVSGNFTQPYLTSKPGHQFKKLELSLKELIGIAVYAITGRFSTNSDGKTNFSL